MADAEGDASAVTEECAICMNVYRRPKLLSCRHTFCSICIKKIHSSSKNPRKIPCPVCRQVTELPVESDVDSLLSNFFVQACDMYVCDSCDAMSKVGLMECSSCSFSLCKPCFENHEMGDDGCNNKRRDSDDMAEPTLYPDDPSMRFTIRHLLNGIIRSCYCGNLYGDFSVPGAGRVTKVVPISAYSAWVLLDNGPVVFRFNLSGQLEDRRTVDFGETLDICWNEKTDLLAVCKGVASVLKVSSSGSDVFIDTGTYQPTSLCNYRNDGFVIGALDVDSEVTASYIMVYDSDKNLVYIRGINERLTFKRINSVSYNDFTRQVCVADEERSMVYLLGNGMACETYKKKLAFPTRSRPMEIERPDRFTPTSICCDQDGTIFVYDYSTSSIHVLNANGKLLGMLLGSDEDHTGDPACITFGPDGKLWIGDMFSGQIRIYTVDQVFNGLRQRSVRMQRHRTLESGEGLHGVLGRVLGNAALCGSEELSLDDLNQMFSDHEQGGDILDLLSEYRLNGMPSVSVVHGRNGIEINSTQNPNDPMANRQARRAFAFQVLNDPQTQSRFEADGISVEEVLRACTEADDL
ncbi:uncharacterized protein LOC132546290 [Ylistrum balloti]|uniref:uncharacterized protein LOC132546290 n=1 Tax=Ylistrum balloti TaxID=509963 RepID=UPI002905D356|nr:uncharacterized protein LOC132546290 [Ylistrum balloti]